MKKTSAALLLKDQIAQKELELTTQGNDLKLHFQKTCESLKPANVVKSTLKNLAGDASVPKSIVNTAIGLGAGHLVNKAVVGSSESPLKKILGALLEVTVANKVSEHADDIKSVVGNLVVKAIQGLRKKEA